MEGIAQRLAERRELTLEHSRQWISPRRPRSAELETIDGEPEIAAATREVLEEGARKLADELRLSLDYYGTQDGAVAVEEIVFCGPGSAVTGLPENLAKRARLCDARQPPGGPRRPRRRRGRPPDPVLRPRAGFVAMRPVNLIPPEQRRGTAAPTRTGSLVYVVIGALALILVGVTAMVVFGKKVDDKKTEVATLEVKAAETSARAESLATYTTFQSIHDARVATVSQLATSRFDWERVLEELSRVLPQHIWLTNLTGTVTPDVQVEDAGAEDGGLRDSIPGPALVLAGCGRSHDDVARLVAAMKDIDGITRVTAADSSKSDSSSGSSTGSCQTKPSDSAVPPGGGVRRRRGAERRSGHVVDHDLDDHRDDDELRERRRCQPGRGPEPAGPQRGRPGRREDRPRHQPAPLRRLT